ncbi:MAG: methionyl-tRNA formyltransferase [Candidatus Kuenenbacteria bacterium]
MNKNNPTKIIFFGTSEFAEVILDKLINVGAYRDTPLRIMAVVTQPDKPVGRKKIITPPLVKIFAEKNNLPVYQPENVGAYCNTPLQEADIFIVADYGEIISKKILDIPKYGALNVHPSLLPKYRGPSPIQTALLNGDKETGVTIIKMDEKMDHGKAISNKQLASTIKRSQPINKEDTYITLSQKLARLGADLLVEVLPDYISGKIKPKEQEHERATYTKMIEKKDGEIDWNKTAEEIYNQWRAFIKWPGSHCVARYKIQNTKYKIKLNKIKVYKDNIKIKDTDLGEFFVENKKLMVKCGGDTYLEILKLQPEGKKEMDAENFVNGYLK